MDFDLMKSVADGLGYVFRKLGKLLFVSEKDGKHSTILSEREQAALTAHKELLRSIMEKAGFAVYEEGMLIHLWYIMKDGSTAVLVVPWEENNDKNFAVNYFDHKFNAPALHIYRYVFGRILNGELHILAMLTKLPNERVRHGRFGHFFLVEEEDLQV